MNSDQPCLASGCLSEAVVKLPVCENCARQVMARWRRTGECPPILMERDETERAAEGTGGRA
jgi:hypothetical protein